MTTPPVGNRINFATDWAYAPAPESAGHAKLLPRYDLFIDGKFVPPVEGGLPATPSTPRRRRPL